MNHIDRIKSSCQAVGGPKKALECQIVQLGRKRFCDIGRPRKDFAILDYWGGRPFADLWKRFSEFFSSKEWYHGVQVRHSHPKESGNRSKNGKYLKRQKGINKVVHWKRLSNLSEMFRRHTLCHYGLLGGTSRPTVEERSIFVSLRCSVIWIYGWHILKIWLRCSEYMDKIFWMWGYEWQGYFVLKGKTMNFYKRKTFWT